MSNADALDSYATDDFADRGSARRLDDVGVDAVLGAMIEQRKRSSRPAACETAVGAESAASALSADATDRFGRLTDDDIVDVGPVFEDTPRSQRVAAHSDAFVKVR